jgi:lipopolysaccharide/colanic/teichoic acid biosynthesis glycosyltransferase
VCLQAGVAEVFIKPLSRETVEKRLNFQLKYWSRFQEKEEKKTTELYKTPFSKRAFDIFFASFALLCLSPLLIIVILLMKLESKGPIFYYSLRVGTGYRVFKFYKLRSMFVNADKRLKELQYLNQYNSGGKPAGKEDEKAFLCEECATAGVKCRNPLYSDKNTWCEKQYMINKKQQAGSAFFKLKNDPRVTKVGQFIRNTSIDELPQLWNVIKGDMSIVGNRPLPLYEAEKLTTDKFATRFLAPAGITGLWQVEKRGGKGKMSEEERLMLDNTYALNHNFWYDIKLILRTIPALFQKENV